MKFNMCPKRFVAAFTLMIPVWIGVVHAQVEANLSLAVLNLPPDEDGLLHWRDGDKPTKPIQLSVRYFSEFITLESGILSLYTDPVLEEPEGSPVIAPLYTIRIPPDFGTGFLVLTPQQKGEDFSWRGLLIPNRDFTLGSLKLYNTTGRELGIQLPNHNFKLLEGKSVDLDSKRFPESFPVKIYQLGEDRKKIFSSVWRISPQRREVCFVFMRNRSLKLRSLLLLSPAEEE